MPQAKFDWPALSALLTVAAVLIFAPTAHAKTAETCNSSIAKCGDNPSDGDSCWVNKTDLEGETKRFEGTVKKTGDQAFCVYGQRDVNGNIIVFPKPVIKVSPTTGDVPPTSRGRFGDADATVGAGEPSRALSARDRSNLLTEPTVDFTARPGTCASVCLAGTLWAICEKPEEPGSEAKAAGACPADRFDVTISEDGRRIKTIPLNDGH